MEQEQTQLDAVLGNLDFDAIASGESDTAPAEAPETETPSDEQAVAPPDSEDNAESADDAPATTDAAAPTPSDPETPTTPPVDYDSDANPYKAQAEEARKMRQLLEAAAEKYQQQQYQQQRQERETEIAERIAKLSEDYTPEQAREQARRIRAEVEDSVLADAAKKIEELTLAQQAQKRIASGADTAGAGVGRPATGGPLTKTDEGVARALAAVGLS
jgi:hypothetical protein